MRQVKVSLLCKCACSAARVIRTWPSRSLAALRGTRSETTPSRRVRLPVNGPTSRRPRRDSGLERARTPDRGAAHRSRVAARVVPEARRSARDHAVAFVARRECHAVICLPKALAMNGRPADRHGGAPIRPRVARRHFHRPVRTYRVRLADDGAPARAPNGRAAHRPRVAARVVLEACRLVHDDIVRRIARRHPHALHAVGAVWRRDDELRSLGGDRIGDGPTSDEA